MDEGLEYIFLCMIQQNDVLGAVNFIRSVDINCLPRKNILHTIIFEILMKNDDATCLAFSYDYLMTVLNTFPPSTEEHRQFYYDSIRSSQGFFADLWNLFIHIVNSYFSHRGIYVMDQDDNTLDPIKYPNCKFLLEFYIKLFTLDFHYFKPKSSCLLVYLFWPNETISLSNRTECLLKWINDIYMIPCVNDMGDLLESMHEMLTLMVKCIIQSKHNVNDCSAFLNPSLTEIADAIVNFCKRVFDQHSKVKLFLTSLSFEYLQARVSEKIIRQIIKETPKRPYILTLKDIVNQCMFPKKFNKWKHLKPNVNKEKNLRKRALEKKSSLTITDKKIKTTPVHELCKKNKFGDLSKLLRDTKCENVNARDGAGCTPLHEACQVGSFLCLKALFDESAKASQNLDFSATNFEGETPLHIAVIMDFPAIAKELLRSGGSELLTIADNKGCYPNEYSNSEEMNEILQEFQPKQTSEADITADDTVNEAPVLKSFKDYSIYLHAINCLLCSYCKIFNLYEVPFNKDIIVQSHSEKICCHYIDDDVCSEDADVLLEMPDIVETFIQSVCKNATKLSVNVDIELIPLKLFVASLKAL